MASTVVIGIMVYGKKWGRKKGLDPTSELVRSLA